MFCKEDLVRKSSVFLPRATLFSFARNEASQASFLAKDQTVCEVQLSDIYLNPYKSGHF